MIPGIIANSYQSAGSLEWIDVANRFTDTTGKTAVGDAPIHSEGDLLIARVPMAAPDAENMTAPAGWTQMSFIATGGSNICLATFYKIAGPSEPATYNFSVVNGGSFGGDSYTSIWSFSGAGTPTVVDYAASKTALQSPAITFTNNAPNFVIAGGIRAWAGLGAINEVGYTANIEFVDTQFFATAYKMWESGASAPIINWTTGGDTFSRAINSATIQVPSA